MGGAHMASCSKETHVATRRRKQAGARAGDHRRVPDAYCSRKRRVWKECRKRRLSTAACEYRGRSPSTDQAEHTRTHAGTNDHLFVGLAGVGLLLLVPLPLIYSLEEGRVVVIGCAVALFRNSAVPGGGRGKGRDKGGRT